MLRLGVVGVGHLGRHHARILAAIEGVDLIGVADARLDQARAVAAPLGVAAFADYRDLLDKVDAVTVAVPTRLHREVAGAFLDRGLPAMVEKPLAMGAAEAEELVALARVRGVVLQVGHSERFNPTWAAVEGLGLRPKFIAAERLGVYSFRSTDIGVVLDLMIHDLDLVLSLIAAPVQRVSAVGIGLFGGHEDVADARIEFADGSVAHLTASRASYAATRKMRLWDAEGYVALDFAAKAVSIVRPSDRLRRGELDLDGLDLTQPGAVRDHLFGGKVFRVDRVQAEGREPLALELEDFVAAVRTGRRPKVSGDDALRAMRVADEVIRSLSAHRWEPDAPAAPRPAPIIGLPEPKLWRYHSARPGVPAGDGPAD